jgi:hypothetical protein
MESLDSDVSAVTATRWCDASDGKAATVIWKGFVKLVMVRGDKGRRCRNAEKK